MKSSLICIIKVSVKFHEKSNLQNDCHQVIFLQSKWRNAHLFCQRFLTCVRARIVGNYANKWNWTEVHMAMNVINLTLLYFAVLVSHKCIQWKHCQIMLTFYLREMPAHIVPYVLKVLLKYLSRTTFLGSWVRKQNILSNFCLMYSSRKSIFHSVILINSDTTHKLDFCEAEFFWSNTKGTFILSLTWHYKAHVRKAFVIVVIGFEWYLSALLLITNGEWAP